MYYKPFIYILTSISLIACNYEQGVQRSSDASPVVVSHLTQVELPTGDQIDFADKFIKNFIGYCVQTMPRIDKVESAARSFGWQEIDGDAAAMIAPQEPDTWFRAWFTEIEPGLAMMISIAKADKEKPPLAICSVANPYAPTEVVVASLKKLLPLSSKPIADDIAGGQRMRVWKYDDLMKGSIISVTDAVPMNEPGIAIVIMTPQEYK